METVLYILHVIVCLALLPIILLQNAKGGVGAAFGGGNAGSVFGARGASTFLTKMTSAAAIVFMFTSLGLAYYSSKSKSVVGDVPPLEAAKKTNLEPGTPGTTPTGTASQSP